MKKTAIRHVAISLVALAALVLSLAVFFTRPDASYIDLDHAISTRRSQLNQEFNSFEPEEETQVKRLIWSIKKFNKWNEQ